jgi:Holliday junction resolvasome RuvABC endonuclease subunit
MTVRVLGLDLSITSPGICTPGGSAFSVRTNAKRKDHRLDDIASNIAVYLGGTDLAVIEGMGRFKGNTGQIIAMVHGAVRLELVRAGVPYVVIPPASVKKFATGNGNADKQMMLDAARKHGVDFGTDDDACDAWWLYQAGLHRAEGGELFVPEVWAGALNEVDWSCLPGVHRAVERRQLAAQVILGTDGRTHP